MITVAVAAGDPGANEYYRGLMADAKFNAVFTPRIELLTQCVKSKPVDLIVFDLSSPALSATSWLEAVRQDRDLALTPVLWVGLARPMALATTLDNYRPGARTRQKPNLTTLMELVQKIVGRTSDALDDSGETAESYKEWKPEGGTIDDALSIFADANHANGRHARTLLDDSDEDIFQTSEISRTAPSNNADPEADGSNAQSPGEVLAIPAGGPEEKAVIDLSDVDSQASSQPRSTPADQSSATAVATEPARSKTPEISEELLDEITNKVISRLAAEVFRNLDTGVIRQTVRDVLAEQGQ